MPITFLTDGEAKRWDTVLTSWMLPSPIEQSGRQ